MRGYEGWMDVLCIAFCFLSTGYSMCEPEHTVGRRDDGAGGATSAESDVPAVPMCLPSDADGYAVLSRWFRG